MKLEASWYRQLENEISLPYIKKLKEFLAQEKNEGKIIYPPEPFIFNAFLQTPFAKVKAVIIGQDPYHGPGQAHGLSFSVPMGVKPPPSLKNIFSELQSDLGFLPPSHGCLLQWAQEGVLMLNAILTVRQREPGSHKGIGWEQFTDAVVNCLLNREDPIAFLLWGKFAQEKYEHVKTRNATPHAAFMAAHPSPYSAYNGFFGCRHFSKVNDFLVKNGKSPVHWNLNESPS